MFSDVFFLKIKCKSHVFLKYILNLKSIQIYSTYLTDNCSVKLEIVFLVNNTKTAISN